MSCNPLFGLVSNVAGGSCSQSGQSVDTINLYYPNKAIQIQYEVSGVTNPTSTEPTDSFLFQIYDSNNNLLSAFTGSDSAKYTPTVQTMTMNTDYPARSTDSADVDSIISIKITLVTKIVKDSLIQIKLLSSTIESKSSSYSCNKVVSSTASSVACT